MSFFFLYCMAKNRSSISAKLSGAPNYSDISTSIIISASRFACSDSRCVENAELSLRMSNFESTPRFVSGVIILLSYATSLTNYCVSRSC